jgi:hypothetical protein
MNRPHCSSPMVKFDRDVTTFTAASADRMTTAVVAGLSSAAPGQEISD